MKKKESKTTNLIKYEPKSMKKRTLCLKSSALKNSKSKTPMAQTHETKTKKEKTIYTTTTDEKETKTETVKRGTHEFSEMSFKRIKPKLMKSKKLRIALKLGTITGKYLVHVVTLLIAVSVVTFILVSVSPVDPVQQYVLGAGNVSMEQREAIAEYWGLNAEPIERYFNWLSALLKGDMGTSLLFRQPVTKIIGERFAGTFALMMTSWLFSGLIGFGLGCLMGVWQGKWLDSILKRICLVLSSLPIFWIGLVLLLIFAVWLGWFPIGLSSPIGLSNSEVTIWQRLYHLALPALTLSLTSFAHLALHTRQKLVDVLQSDFVLFARARGESTGTIMKRHGFRNILLPAVTLQFASFAELFGGSVLAENVFSYPGLGSAVSAAGLNSDVPLLLGVTLFSTLFVFTGNLLANIIYGVVDPRIREERINGETDGN